MSMSFRQIELGGKNPCLCNLTNCKEAVVVVHVGSLLFIFLGLTIVPPCAIILSNRDKKVIPSYHIMFDKWGC